MKSDAKTLRSHAAIRLPELTATTLRSRAAVKLPDADPAPSAPSLQALLDCGWLELEMMPSALLEERVSLEQSAESLRDLFANPEPDAAVAVYRLARVLPPGRQKRMLQAHLDELLCTASGERALPVLAAMVMCERRLPRLPGLWRQVGLCFANDLLHPSAQEFALAVFLASELHEQWITRPAEGALHSRLLSVQLLASAAFGAVTRARDDEPFALSLMSSPAQHALRQRLLYDREPLVWRLAALARGWLAAFYPHEATNIEADLDRSLSPTEWRRAGLSLVAMAAQRGDSVRHRIETMRREGLFQADRGLAAVMLHGLWGAPDSEATRSLGLRLLELAGDASAPELRHLVSQCPQSPLLCFVASEYLRRRSSLLDAANANGHDVDDDVDDLDRLLHGRAPRFTVGHSVREAVAAYWLHGPERAYPEALHALTEADRLLDVLQSADMGRPEQVRDAIRGVRDLQRGLLGEGSITHLLVLGPTASRAMSGLSYFRERLTNLLLLGTTAPIEGEVLQLQRERAVAVIRVLDRDELPGASALDESARSRALQVLLERLRQPEQRPLRRPLCAAVARAVDGLVRAGEWERGDPLLLAAVALPDVECCNIMAEASMVPELVDSLSALHACLAADDGTADETRKRLLRLVQSLPGVAGPRMQALRDALAALAADDLCGKDEPLAVIAGALTTLERLALGLSVRLTGRTGAAHDDWHALVVGAAKDTGPHGAACARLEATLRETFTGPAGAWLVRTVRAAFAVLERAPRATRKPSGGELLPNWMPATRELGDYIVLRPVGGGACGSVFLSRRRGQHLRRDARTYALKVPEMGAGTTRLSRDRFLEMFCAEAGALASLPGHPNLAALESFDRSASPVPFLVMEHVRGPSLEAELAAGRMSLERGLRALQGVARGLSVMHAHGIGHLDLKPSNVILRPTGDQEDAVLVDFGLAGRRVRAGCGTHAYAAPEVFGGDVDRCNPCATDVYSFAVLAYEVLTSKPLFEAPNEIAYIAQHVSHDGDPPGLAALADDPQLSQLLPLFRMMLRQDPALRCQIDAALDVLRAVGRSVSGAPPQALSSAPPSARGMAC